MDKQYNPKDVEGKIYKFWEQKGFFNPDKLPALAGGKKRQPFCIIMPPPNANEALHLGHALEIAIQDALTRFNRMRGKKTLWLPGSDHAGFETQVVFEKRLEKEGKSRFDFDPDTLYKMIWDYVQENKHIMEDQTRRMGASCDWSREKFTLDPDIVKLVYSTFKKLYDDDLIYRGKRIINWCPKHQTGLSDLEVKYGEREDKLWYIKYPVINLKSKVKSFIIIATTRPETMLGDTAVAVNPKDKRYKQLIGENVKIPLIDREIPIIADAAVEIDFGTGAVKVTPAHDPLDFEIAGRHNLEILEVIDKNAKMTDSVPQAYRGLKTTEAREKIIGDLKAQGFLEKEELYQHTVGSCYKCGRTIEPFLSEQWFVKVGPLLKKAVTAVKKGQAKFVSKQYEKIYMHWMKILHDWNISRQIVWGIRIPVWYCNAEKSCYVVSDKKPDKCQKCSSTEFYPETDTFDTWFSSGQWPFATLITAQKTDFKTFYPTSVMVTGRDILLFWVARMLMLGMYCTEKVPFKNIFIHGLILDQYRKKMSKSKGNIVNPLAVVEERGADALRMSLVFGAQADGDFPISEEKIIAQQRFANKIWNAARFSLENLTGFNPVGIKPSYTEADKWIFQELKEAVEKTTKDLESFQFHEAALMVYHFFWHSFCDKCIEDVKKRIKEPKSEGDKKTAQFVLWKVLVDSLKLLHPFMPFISEAIYQQIPHRPKTALIVEEWPDGK